MYRYQLALEKANVLRQRFIDGEYHSYLLAKELRVSTITTWRYKREFERIRAEYPERLNDFGFYPGEPPRPHWQTSKYTEFQFIIPVLIAQEQTKTLNTQIIWEKYCQYCSDKYTFSTFKEFLSNGLRKMSHKHQLNYLITSTQRISLCYANGDYPTTIGIGRYPKL
jgi:hypothetical protein